ncbi:hypothetical protein BHM03_00051164, partial [Ensete ventricosum]
WLRYCWLTPHNLAGWLARIHLADSILPRCLVEFEALGSRDLAKVSLPFFFFSRSRSSSFGHDSLLLGFAFSFFFAFLSFPLFFSLSCFSSCIWIFDHHGSFSLKPYFSLSRCVKP